MSKGHESAYAGTAPPYTVIVVVGTRPEAIKMAPVIKALEESVLLRPYVLATGQHEEMLLSPLRFFGLEPDSMLRIMKEGQTLDYVTAAVLTGAGDVLDAVSPDVVLVHGDTTTTFAATLASFYRGIPVGHVEAGLRSGRLATPFPEELNRVLTDAMCTLWYAPTTNAYNNLVAEGRKEDRIEITGNTVVDALLWASQRVRRPDNQDLAALPKDVPTVLLTAHRRESWGKGLENICYAVMELLKQEPALWFLVPMHLNPRVRTVIQGILGREERVILCDPLAYPDFVWAMKRCSLILSDSGGVQEEAPALGKPVLVLRDVTERPEAVECGSAELVGTETARITLAVRQKLKECNDTRAAPKTYNNPFGDGKAAERIRASLEAFLGSDSGCGSSEEAYSV
ncbi:MAG: UDP-N-acetylglucosamine 2-epimerase (non-hydrolyzing) [Synergistales bacterium]|nr:UDP-N-acetylglucosamine 2-epimerase (non-hydrolyzing) [Synergistales bacterium]